MGALWTGILVLSLLGLRRWCTARSWCCRWLAVYAAPLWLAGRGREVPPGIAVSFIVIVLVWPWLIPWRHLLAG